MAGQRSWEVHLALVPLQAIGPANAKRMCQLRTEGYPL